MHSYNEAIVVRNATKKYGNNQIILNGLNMTVSRGSIYGLLGASGCGKTTLLSCIVGIRELNNGEIWVFGGTPGSKKSLIPGPGVGFMPQEISLVLEFTVKDAINYFGCINGVEINLINERYEFLSKLLQLPDDNIFIKNMSGGQQRRVSLACALIHEPELLILDEPTVGLDPILRENIWSHLSTLTKRGITIIVTTHYIDEAKLANRIGLLRNGKLLAESSPQQLLTRCHCNSLEEAFLRLSQKQEDSGGSGNGLQQIDVDNNVEYLPELNEINSSSTTVVAPASRGPASEIVDQNHNENINNYNKNVAWKNVSTDYSINRIRQQKFKALLIKNFVQFLRHPSSILMALLLPLVQMNIFFNAIGSDPKNLSMAIVNKEAGDCQSGNYIGEVIYSPDNYVCDFVNLSCRFLDVFHHKIAKNIYYNDPNDAINSVLRGEASGYVYFGKNFSHSLQERLMDYHVDDIASGQIQIRLDMGNHPIALYLEKNLYDRFFDTYSDVMDECKLPKKLADPPLRLEKPIFGKRDGLFTTFIAPTFTLTLLFFISTSVSSSIIIADRSEGVWNRSLVQGVTTTEILISHLLTQIVVIIIQVAIAMLIGFKQYNLECNGSMTTVTILIFLTSVCGLCWGFFVSVICTSHTFAHYITTGTFFPLVMLCGCIWPIEGMPKVLRFIGYSLPTAAQGNALRNILSKGYRFDNPQIYEAFIIIIAWIILFVITSVIGLKKIKI